MSITELPYELILYISDIGKLCTLFVKINKEYKNIFIEETRNTKYRYYKNKLINNILIEKKQLSFRKSSFGHFTFYFLHNFTTIQECVVFKKWWIKNNPNRDETLLKRNIEYVMGYYYHNNDDKLELYREFIEIVS